jgi:hypothetical protein
LECPANPARADPLTRHRVLPQSAAPFPEGIVIMSVFVLSCLTYLAVALPGSTLGLIWPSMRVTLHETLGPSLLVLALGMGAVYRMALRSGKAVSP